MPKYSSSMVILIGLIGAIALVLVMAVPFVNGIALISRLDSTAQALPASSVENVS